MNVLPHIHTLSLSHTHTHTHTHTCLTGSGTLLKEQASTSCTAVSSEILCPTDTYTGLVASADVRTACVINYTINHSAREKVLLYEAVQLQSV